MSNSLRQQNIKILLISLRARRDAILKIKRHRRYVELELLAAQIKALEEALTREED